MGAFSDPYSLVLMQVILGPFHPHLENALADERKEIARVVLETVGGRIPTTIHVGCADTPTTIALAKDAVEKGAPAVAVVPPLLF